jgi:hypothetical protein
VEEKKNNKIMMNEYMVHGKEGRELCLITVNKYPYFCWEDLDQTANNCIHDRLFTTEI